MIEITAQPNASGIPRNLLMSIVESVSRESPGIGPEEIDDLDRHSNDLAQVRFRDGRTLMVKRGRYDWAAERFETARIVSRLLRGEAGVVAPAPMSLPDGLDDRPLEAYWRIDLPTLEDLWPQLTDPQRAQAFHGLGGLLRRMHEVSLPGHGRFPRAMHEHVPITQFLAEDLGGRLLPAVTGTWPGGIALVEGLLGELAEVGARTEEARLLHADLHLGNVLCEVAGDEVRCVGLLDLEAAFAGPPEADLANLQVSNTPLFARPLEGSWMEPVTEGYREELDSFLLAFFRIYHLVNMGFWSALVGHEWHAHQVAHAARQEIREMHAAPSSSVTPRSPRTTARTGGTGTRE